MTLTTDDFSHNCIYIQTTQNNNYWYWYIYSLTIANSSRNHVAIQVQHYLGTFSLL